ncbi:MAG: tRNA (5-methylaminomethyl-2-thiouridine)(34)-methyltransferase MnmD [Persicimonas sp.]
MTDRKLHNPNDITVVDTRDGSKTLYDKDKQVHYRSVWGARRESRYVFVEGSGLTRRPAPWRVLELGFGAAVNFTQTVEACLRTPGATLDYHAVEYAPVEPSLLEFHRTEAGDIARRALAQLGETGEPTAVEPALLQPASVEGCDGRVRLNLYPTRWLDLSARDLLADAIYYDPFGPRSEPDSWSTECFEVAARHMAPHAILATYSAATHVKRAIFAAGLVAATAPGPGRKREITFAAHTPDILEGRDGLELLSRDRYLSA